MRRSSLHISFLLVLALVCVNAQSNVLTFALITSFGQFGMNSSGVVPAIDMALRDINNSSGLLPGYTLAYDRVRDSQVSRPLSLIFFFAVIGLTFCVGVLVSYNLNHLLRTSMQNYEQHACTCIYAISNLSAYCTNISDTVLNTCMRHHLWLRYSKLRVEFNPHICG